MYGITGHGVYNTSIMFYIIKYNYVMYKIFQCFAREHFVKQAFNNCDQLHKTLHVLDDKHLVALLKFGQIK